MGKIRRGGFVFITWKGDHPPPHVHVYKNGKFIVKWDLQRNQAIVGKSSRRLREMINELRREGEL